MASDLPSFSGQNAKCTKCGTGSLLRIVWHAGCLNKGFPCELRPGEGQHLCRTCPCCGYGRIEATADATEDTPDLRSVPGGAGQ